MKRLVIVLIAVMLLLSGCTKEDSIHMTIDNIGNLPTGGGGSSGNVTLQFAQGINWLGEFATPPISPNVSDAYHNTSNGTSYVWNGSIWQTLAESGATGPQGIPGQNGTNGTNGTNGVNGTIINYTGNASQYLDGTGNFTVPPGGGLPDMAGNAGKVLTNDGSIAIWAANTSSGGTGNVTGNFTVSENISSGNLFLNVIGNVQQFLLNLSGNITANFNTLTAHIARNDNPHNVTADQVAVYVPGTNSSNANYRFTWNGTNVVLQPPSFVGASTYYFQNTTANVDAYKTMLPGTTFPTLTTLTYASVTNNQTIQGFITLPNTLTGQTSIPAGAYDVHIHARQSGGTQNTQLHAQIWETDASGANISIIGEGEMTPVLTGTFLEYDMVFVNSNTYTFASNTSRILVVVHTLLSGGGSSPSVQIQLGSTADSHIALPATTVDTSQFANVNHTHAITDVVGLSQNLTDISGNASGNWSFLQSVSQTVSNLAGNFTALWKSGVDAAVTFFNTFSINSPTDDQVMTWDAVQGKWVNKTISIPVSAGPGVSYFYSHNTSGQPTGYEMILTTPDTVNPEQDETVDNESAIECYSSPLGGLGLTSIPSGQWNFNFYTYVANPVVGSYLKADIFKMDTNNATTLLFSINTTAIDETSITTRTVTIVEPSFAVSATDRLAICVYASTDSLTNTVHFVHSGSIHYSNFQTPLVVSHNDLPGLQGGTAGEFYHLTAAQLAIVNEVNANLANKADLNHVHANLAVNGYALSSNITLTYSDVGAANVTHTHPESAITNLVQDLANLSGNISQKVANTFAGIVAALGYTPADNSTLGQNNGIATLNSTGDVVITQLPLGVAGGAASLNGDAIVPATQLGGGSPSINTYLNGAGNWVGLVSNNWSTVKLTTNITTTNNATGKQIPGFTFVPAAGNVYEFWALVYAGNNATGQAPRIQVTWPTGGTGTVEIQGSGGASGNVSWSVTGNSSAAVVSNNGTWISSANTSGLWVVSGVWISAGAPSGNISINILAPFSNPVNTSKVFAGSIFRYIGY